jgi:2-oxoglutarate ferredoxin oxidoreductase subunit alpha
MAIGSALTGARSATATSGPGFSLMAEALGWAGMNEVSVVISLYQRAGPSTGLPTRHEQGDLIFAINAGHGEFPRIVLASGDIEESFYDTIKVFNLADRYQMPIIHMLDKAIANSVTTCKIFDPGKIEIDRGSTVGQITDKDKGAAGNYLRFKLSENPISPKVALGTKDAMFWNTGDEHTEEGHITEDPEMRVRMMDKRMNKLKVALKEMPDEDKAVAYGSGDVAILSWGSTKGVILDLMEKLESEGEGRRIKFVQVRLMSPFPSELVKSMLKGAKMVIDIEMNYTGQLGSLVRQHTGVEADYQIVKYNGRPISLDEVYNAVMRILGGDAPRRQVLKSGT